MLRRRERELAGERTFQTGKVEPALGLIPRRQRNAADWRSATPRQPFKA
jgi:hypothetical protein